METVSRPSQILPIAILWYDSTEKFTLKLLSANSISKQTAQHSNEYSNNIRISVQRKVFYPAPKSRSSLILNSDAEKNSTHNVTTNETVQNSNTPESLKRKYPSHLMITYHRLHSDSSVVEAKQQYQQSDRSQQISSSRDPRLLCTKQEMTLKSSETISLSPQNSIDERTTFRNSLMLNSSKVSLNGSLSISEKNSSLIHIPLNSFISLIDPRLKTIKQTRNIFYLELQAVKHAIQQQKRLNRYTNSKTSYTLIPFRIRQVSNTDYQRLLNDNNNIYQFYKHSNDIKYSLLHVSVIDCMDFSLTTNNHTYIDLEKNQNKLAYEQIEKSNELIEREKQLNSRCIHLRLREKRQRKIQQQINERIHYEKPHFKTLTHSKLCVATGRQLLKQHKSSIKSPNTHISLDLLDFFSREYKNENQSHIKYLLAELAGIFTDKYHTEKQQTEVKRRQSEQEIDISTKGMPDSFSFSTEFFSFIQNSYRQ